MLISFAVQNFRSYWEEKTFSMVASPSEELPQNILECGGLRLLRSAAIYGANASGKSNLLLAMDCLSDILSDARSFLPLEEILVPFALNPASAKTPIRFAVKFLMDEIVHEYEISLRPAPPFEVENEGLVVYPLGRPQEWFRRTGDTIEFNKTYLRGPKHALQEVTPSGMPLLCAAVRFNHPQLSPPARWLVKNLGSSTALPFPAPSRAEGVARRCLQNKHFHSWIRTLLQHADLGIRDVEVQLVEVKRRRASARRSQEGVVAPTIEEVIEEHHEPRFVHTGVGKLQRASAFRMSRKVLGDCSRCCRTYMTPCTKGRWR